MRKKPLGRSLIIGVFLISALLIGQEYMIKGGVAKVSVAVPGIAFYSDRTWHDNYDYDITEGSVIGGRGPILVRPYISVPATRM